jgi:hypothetical protein
MMPHSSRARLRRFAAALAISVGPLSAALLSSAGCAVADESNRAATDDDGGILIPAPDAGDEASLVDADAGTESPGLPCAVGNLCRVQIPLTRGFVASLSGRSKDDVWAGGSSGVVMHWNGQEWAALDSEIHETLSSLFLTADETWGVAGSLVLRRRIEASSVRTFRVNEFSRSLSGVAVLENGEAYISYLPPYFLDTTPDVLAKITDFDTARVTFEPDPVLAANNQAREMAVRAVFLVPDRALWLVGNHANIARYPVSPALGAGVVMPVASRADLLAAWGQGDHLWAAGGGGTILHFDGTDWNEEETGTKATLNAIFGFAPDDIWAAGDEGTVLHFDGDRWSRIEMGGYRGHLRAIWGHAPDDVWVGGERAMFHWGALP